MKNLLGRILEEYDEWRGNAGCNDLILPYSDELWRQINEIFEYGVKYNLWDRGCPPLKQGDKIAWFDFAVSSFFVHALSKGYLKIEWDHVKILHDFQMACQHEWQFDPDPSGNNDSGYFCNKCNRWSKRMDDTTPREFGGHRGLYPPKDNNPLEFGGQKYP